METIAGAMSGMPRDIVSRRIVYSSTADPAYGQSVGPSGVQKRRAVRGQPYFREERPVEFSTR